MLDLSLFLRLASDEGFPTFHSLTYGSPWARPVASPVDGWTSEGEPVLGVLRYCRPVCLDAFLNTRNSLQSLAWLVGGFGLLVNGEPRLFY